MGQNRQEKSLQIPYQLPADEMFGKGPGGKGRNRPAAVMLGAVTFSFVLVFAEHTSFNKQIKAQPDKEAGEPDKVYGFRWAGPY